MLKALCQCHGCHHDFLPRGPQRPECGTVSYPDCTVFFRRYDGTHDYMLAFMEGWPDTLNFVHMNFPPPYCVHSMQLMEHILFLFRFRPYRPTTCDLPSFADPDRRYQQLRGPLFPHILRCFLDFEDVDSACFVPTWFFTVQ